MPTFLLAVGEARNGGTRLSFVVVVRRVFLLWAINASGVFLPCRFWVCAVLREEMNVVSGLSWRRVSLVFFPQDALWWNPVMTTASKH